MAKKQLELECRAFLKVVRQLFMGLLVDLADGVAIGHLEIHEVLNHGVESIFESFDTLFLKLVLDKQRVLYVKLLLDPLVKLVDYFGSLGVQRLSFAHEFDFLPVDEVQQNLIDIKLEGCREVEAQEVEIDNSLYDSLYELYPGALPL